MASLKQGSTLVLKRNPNWDRSTDPVRTAQPDTIVYTMGLDPTVINQRLIADQGKDSGIPGYQAYDKFPADPTGDLAKAKALLSQQGRP